MIRGAHYACASTLEYVRYGVVCQLRRLVPSKRFRNATVATLWALEGKGRDLGLSIRRAASRRIVTITVGDELIRAVIIRGREVEAWATLAAVEETGETISESGQTDGSLVLRLRSLLKQIGVGRGRVVAGFPVYACLLRHLRLPRVANRYLGQVLLSEIQETIPFSAETVDISYRIQRRGSTLETFSVVLPRSSTDHHVQVLKGAGLRPSAAYSGATAQSCVCGIPDVVLVYLDSRWAHVVPVSSGMPRLVHRVPLAPNNEDPDGQAYAVATAVEQAAACEETYDQPRKGLRLPVMVLGEESRRTNMEERLHETLGRDLLAFSTPLVCPAEFDAGEYALNIGLAIAAKQKRQARAIDLLPERHRYKRVAVRSAGVAIGLLLLTASAFLANTLVVVAEENAARRSHEVEMLEQKERQHRLIRAAGQVIETSIQDSDESRGKLESHMDMLSGEVKVVLAKVATATRDSVARGVQVSEFALRGGELSLSGTAPSREEVFRYVSILKESGLFPGVAVKRVETSGLANAGDGDAAKVQFWITAF